MGVNKVNDELVSMVRSIVGSEYSNMDVIRALHMAKNDPTAAINIIFDTPSFRKAEIPRNPVGLNRNLNSEPQTALLSSNRSGDEDSGCKTHNLNSGSSSNGVVKGEIEDSEREGKSEDVRNLSSSGCSSSMGSEWWLVGRCEIAGLSTCKGRSLRPGEEVNFTFPVERKLNSRSPGKFGGGRGRQVAACSEIVRFSTQACGEVVLLII